MDAFDEWVAELRSGKWQQGKEALYAVPIEIDEDGEVNVGSPQACCLGVLECKLNLITQRFPDDSDLNRAQVGTDQWQASDIDGCQDLPGRLASAELYKALRIRFDSNHAVVINACRYRVSGNESRGSFDPLLIIPPAMTESLPIGHLIIPGTDARARRCSSLNDAGATFAQIADLLEINKAQLQFGVVA